MGKELQIIIIEDDPADAARLTHELENCGLEFHSECVASREDFLRALEHEPDLILSDHGLPCFSGFTALSIIQERCLKVPFIFVTGWYDQGLMVEMFDSGAAGYVYKNRLSDLGPVIRQALEEAESGEDAAAAPAAAEPPTGATPPPDPKPVREIRVICSQCKKVRGENRDWEPIEACLNRQRQVTITLGMCPDCASKRSRPASN